MKPYYKIFLLIIGLIITEELNARVLYDQKYVTPGVLSNVSITELTDNPNIRFLGTYPETQLSSEAGRLALHKLINLNNPDVKALYQQALKESTVEEREIAEKNITATPELILQQEGAMQLLKNNYVVIVKPEINKAGENTGKNIWTVYHINIDDEIINQVFYNWSSPEILKTINPSSQFIDTGKIKKNNMSLIIYEIQKKVGAFAIRGPIIANHPTTAAIGENQSVRKGFRMKVFKTIENKKGKTLSKKIADARATNIGKDNTKLKIIAGKYPNYKNGDIAIVSGRGGWTLNIEGQYSHGPDWKTSGKIFTERLLRYYSSGISTYFIMGGEFGMFNKAPEKIWYEKPSFSSPNIQPRLCNIGAFFGYGLGVSLLTKFELIPYFTVGGNFYSDLGIKEGYIWNEDDQQFMEISGNPNHDIDKSFMALNVEGGVRLAINIIYPLQLTVGCNYNYTLPMDNGEEFSVSKRHKWNRVNGSIGFRYNF